MEAAKHTYIHAISSIFSVSFLGVLGQKAEDYCEQKLQELQLSFTKAIDQVTERMQADLRHSSGRGDESDESDASTSQGSTIRSSNYPVLRTLEFLNWAIYRIYRFPTHVVDNNLFSSNLVYLTIKSIKMAMKLGSISWGNQGFEDCAIYRLRLQSIGKGKGERERRKERGEGKGEGKETRKDKEKRKKGKGKGLCVCACACIWSRVNCAIYSAWSVCIYVRVDMIGEFCLVNCAIWSSLCVFYVSQSELRHLQCIVCVCVCACDRALNRSNELVGRALNMAALNLKLTAPPAVALAQNLWNKSWESHRKPQDYESNRYLPKIAMIFGVVPYITQNHKFRFYGQAAPSTVAI